MSAGVMIAVRVLATLLAVIATGRLLGVLCRRLGQPPVIGEALAGIALGPSLLGAVWPAAQHFLLPEANVDPQGRVLAALAAVSHVGVTLYMFIVGLELSAAQLRRQARAALIVSQASILAPLALGAALAWALYPHWAPAGISLASFAAFLGVAMSITAFPVLARILSDRGMLQTPLGRLAMASAAVQDIAAWCLLAVVIGVLRTESDGGLSVVAGTAALVSVMLFVVRPLVERWHHAHVEDSQRPPSALGLLFGLAAVAASAAAAHGVGIHGLVGAFLLGLVIPHDGALAKGMIGKLSFPVQTFLLPAFFALTGLRTELGLVERPEDWLVCAAIVAVATAGKLGGAALAARAAGQSWHDAWSLGVLMNTRGLMELIVLGMGLEIGVIGPRLFTMMVIMALATTLATGPLLNLLGNRHTEST